MGYRSLVAYTIRFVDDHDTKNEQSFSTFLAEAKSKIPALWAGEKDSIHEWLEIDMEKLQFNFHTPYDIKWYPNYPDVMVHDQLWELAGKFHEDNDAISGKFVMIGENPDDIEIMEFGDADCAWLDVSRQIICDWV